MELVDALREGDVDASRVDTVTLPQPQRSMHVAHDARAARIIIALAAAVAIGSLVLLVQSQQPDAAPPMIEVAPPRPPEPALEPEPEPKIETKTPEPKKTAPPKPKKHEPTEEEDDLLPDMPIRF
jgi:hypothetical protein